jgi:hypothetical protein
LKRHLSRVLIDLAGRNGDNPVFNRGNVSLAIFRLSNEKFEEPDNTGS